MFLSAVAWRFAMTTTGYKSVGLLSFSSFYWKRNLWALPRSKGSSCKWNIILSKASLLHAFQVSFAIFTKAMCASFKWLYCSFMKRSVALCFSLDLQRVYKVIRSLFGFLLKSFDGSRTLALIVASRSKMIWLQHVDLSWSFIYVSTESPMFLLKLLTLTWQIWVCDIVGDRYLRHRRLKQKFSSAMMSKRSNGDIKEISFYVNIKRSQF